MLARNALKFSSSAARTSFPRVLAAQQQQVRSAATTAPTTNDEAYSLLLAQRKRRPLAPHLTIYKPQLTSVGSSMNRITGVFLSSSVYLFGMSYALAPLMGMHVETATIAAAVAGIPLAVKLMAKFLYAAPFAYHSINGLRHLNWDMAKSLDIKGVYATGYAVLGATTLATGYLTFLA